MCKDLTGNRFRHHCTFSGTRFRRFLPFRAPYGANFDRSVVRIANSPAIDIPRPRSSLSLNYIKCDVSKALQRWRTYVEHLVLLHSGPIDDLSSGNAVRRRTSTLAVP